MPKPIIHNSRFIIPPRGIVSLGATLILAGIIVEIGLVFGILAYLLSQAGFGERLSQEALAAAQAGIEDGLMRVIRSDPSVTSYSYSFGAAAVRVCKELLDGTVSGCGSSAAPNKYEIIALGQIFTRKRQMVAVVEVNSLTRQMKIELVKEVPL